MRNLRLRQRARLTILIMGFLMLCLSFVGWWALHQTQQAAAELQSRTLNDISTAMGLAERVAQIAALAPYIGESAQPFQLQTERRNLDQRFAALDELVLELSNPDVKAEVSTQIGRLREQLLQLVDQVEQELFLREDLLVTRFELEDWSQNYLDDPGDPGLAALGGLLQVFRQTLTATPLSADTAQDVLAQVESQARVQLADGDADANGLVELLEIIDDAGELLQTRAGITTTKTLLFANNRAQSEALTQYVQDYVMDVQANLLIEREAMEESVMHGRIGIVLVSILAVLALLEGFWFMFRATRDLEGVTHDMTQLAEGDTRSGALAVNRNDEIGELARTFDVFRDASVEMVRVSREMKDQTQLLETVLNTINDGLSVFSADRRLLAWNDRYLDIFGLARRSVYKGMTFEAVQALMREDSYRLVSLDNPDLSVQDLNALRETEGQTFERHYQSGRVIEFRSEPMPGGGFVTLHTDLTDRRAVEQQLVQAQKMEVLGQLTGGVAHDFNNLLAALIGNLQLLEASSGLPDTERRYANRALGVAERGAHLVERLLAFSRKQRLNPEVVVLGELLEGMQDLVEYSVSPQVRVRLALRDNDSPVWVDPSQLENAVLNLAINASAAMPEGGDLWLCTRRIDNAGQPPQVELEVRDTGTGMSEELMHRVWEPFYTTKPAGQGSGLGLSLVYGFVKQSGGDVVLESSPGRGTCIRLSLPVHLRTHAAQTEHQPDVPTRIALGERRTVLLVEDDLSVQNVLRDEFSTLHIDVLAFTSAEAALEALREGKDVGAVLSDINLAGAMDGVQLAHEIASIRPDTPVILTSGLPREHLRQHFGLTDRMPLLTKPVRLQQLKQVFVHDS